MPKQETQIEKQISSRLYTQLVYVCLRPPRQEIKTQNLTPRRLLTPIACTHTYTQKTLTVSQLNERQPFIDKTDSHINRLKENKPAHHHPSVLHSGSRRVSVCVIERERPSESTDGCKFVCSWGKISPGGSQKSIESVKELEEEASQLPLVF